MTKGRIFLMCSQHLYLDVAKNLQKRGIEPVLAYVTDEAGWLEEFSRAMPDAEVLPSFPLIGARLPNSSKVVLKPASTADIEALAPWEGATLQMMDRRNFDGLALHDMRHLYHRYISMWRSLLDHHRPDAVHFHPAPHQGHDFVLYQLCHRLGIPTLIVESAYLKDRLFIRTSLDETPTPTADQIAHELKRFNGDPPSLIEAAQHAVSRKLVDRNDIDRNLSFLHHAKQLLSPRAWLLAMRPVRDNVFGLTQRRPPEMLYRFYEMRGRRGVAETYRFYKRHSKKVEATGNFIYMPLHYQPEKTTLPDGLRFVDQLHLAEVIASALPKGWKLYVKEHARQFNLSYGLRGVAWTKGRSMNFYRRLASMPGIEMVDLSVDSAQLVARSRAVATITGTSAWEGLQIGVPALIFGTAWYGGCPGVIRITDTERTAAAIASIADGRVRVDVPTVRAYAHAMIANHTFRGVHWDPLVSQTGMTGEELGKSYGDALEAAFFEATKKRGAVLAS